MTLSSHLKSCIQDFHINWQLVKDIQALLLTSDNLLDREVAQAITRVERGELGNKIYIQCVEDALAEVVELFQRNFSVLDRQSIYALYHMALEKARILEDRGLLRIIDIKRQESQEFNLELMISVVVQVPTSPDLVRIYIRVN